MARHRGRELALKVLFEHDLAKTEPDELLHRSLHGEGGEDREFVENLVRGALSGRDRIDGAIEEAAIGWRVGRMPTIDRNILRLAAYELIETPETPISVIIDEALELAQSYSTDEAKKFVNGVLSTLAKRFRPEGDHDRRAVPQDVQPN